MKAREFYELQTHDSTCVVGIMDKDEIITLMDAFCDAEVDKMVSERLRGMTERCKKLEFMIDNGLGWDDMRNDISMPHEL